MPAPYDHSPVDDLAEHLVVEYAGGVPPGQVVSAVERAHVLACHSADAGPARLALCESIARRLLHDRIVANRRAWAAAPRFHPARLPKRGT